MSQDQIKTTGEETVVAGAPVPHSSPLAAKAAKAAKAAETPAWKSVLIGGVPGIVLGAGAAIGAEAVMANASEVDLDNDVEAPADTADAAAQGSAPVASSVNDSMSFADAFAAARAEVGAGGVFTWHGNLYGTYYETEWNAMSEQDRSDYFATINGGSNNAGNYAGVDAGAHAGASGLDSLSFADAFAAARAELGAGGVFTWHGQQYGTFYENEWNNMSDAQRNDYYASVNNGSAPHSSAEHVYAGAPAAASGLDSMSFADAFAAARAELGAGGVFTWHGQTYNTFYENEWNGMSGSERNQFLASLNGDAGCGCDDGYSLGDGQPMDQADQSDILSQQMGDDIPDLPNDHYLSDNQLENNDVYDGMPDYTSDADTSSFA